MTHNWNVSTSEAEVQGPSELCIQTQKKRKKEYKTKTNKLWINISVAYALEEWQKLSLYLARVLGVQSYWLGRLVDRSI